MKAHPDNPSPENPEDREAPEKSGGVQQYGGELDAKARRARNIIIAVAVIFSLLPGLLFLLITLLN